MEKRFAYVSLALSVLVPTATGLWTERMHFAGAALFTFLGAALVIYLVCLFVDFDQTHYIYYFPRLAAWFGWWSGHALLPIESLEKEEFWMSVLDQHTKRQVKSLETVEDLQRHMCEDALSKLQALRRAAPTE